MSMSVHNYILSLKMVLKKKKIVIKCQSQPYVEFIIKVESTKNVERVLGPACVNKYTHTLSIELLVICDADTG